MAFEEKQKQSATFTQNTESNASTEQVKVPLLRNLIGRYSSSGVLSPEANDYLSKIREILEDSTNTIKVETKRLNRPNGAVLFKSGEFGIIVIFDEMNLIDINQILRNSLIMTSFVAAKEIYPNIKILNVVLVTKYDYKKYNQMANYINKCLMVYNDSSANNITIKSFGNMNSFVLETNMDIVKSSIENLNPHGIPGRGDFGFVCYAVNKNTNNTFNNNDFSEKQELFTVTGYVEPVPCGVGSDIKFIPVIHVTEIVTSFMSPRLIVPIKAITCEAFAAYELWKLPFKSLKKGSINIGNLLIDPKTNKPMSIKTENELNVFFSKHFTPPIIVFDIVEGRARIPGLALLSNQKLHGKLSEEICKFFEADINTNIGIVSGQPNIDMVGYAEIQGLVPGADVVDSRYIDYLNIVNLLGYDERVGELFHKYMLDPIKRCELIKSISNNVRFLYLNHEVMLNGNVIKELVSAISGYVSIINPFNQSLLSSVDLQGLLNNAYTQSPLLASRTGGVRNVDWRQGYYGII